MMIKRLILFTCLLVCSIGLVFSDKFSTGTSIKGTASTSPISGTSSIAATAGSTTTTTGPDPTMIYCENVPKKCPGGKCASVYTIEKTRNEESIKSIDIKTNYSYNPEEILKINFLGTIVNKTLCKDNLIYKCGFKVPTFASLCDKKGKSQLLFVCESNGAVDDRCVIDNVWPEFRTDNLLKCATTRCRVAKPSATPYATISNPYYPYCVNDKVTSYDNFLLYGNIEMNAEILTKSHFCTLSIFTDTFLNGSNVLNNPLVLAGAASGDYGFSLNDTYKYIPNDQRWYKWYPANATTSGMSVYWCTATDPKVKCNWNDHHIAMESHIRMVNISNERHLPVVIDGKPKFRIGCIKTGHKVGSDDVSKGLSDREDFAKPECDSNDRCIQLYDSVGCVADVLDVIEPKNATDDKYKDWHHEYLLICKWLPPTAFGEVKKCFKVDYGRDKIIRICCCKSDCIEKTTGTPASKEKTTGAPAIEPQVMGEIKVSKKP